jgi:hypothetical protein
MLRVPSAAMATGFDRRLGAAKEATSARFFLWVFLGAFLRKFFGKRIDGQENWVLLRPSQDGAAAKVGSVRVKGSGSSVLRK